MFLSMRRCLYFAIVLLAFPVAHATAQESDGGSEKLEFREFVDFRGRKATMALVGFQDDTVQLKRKDGRLVVLDLDKLSEADQRFVKSWASSGNAVPPVLDSHYGEPFSHWAARLNSDEVDYEAFNAMTKFGPQGVPLLIAALEGDNDNRRAYAARSLGKLGAFGRPAMGKLVGLLGDESYGPRNAAISALAEMGEPAVPLLAKQLISLDARTRASAAEALRNPSKYDQQIISKLVGLLEDEDYTVRSSAASALRQKGETAVQPLLAALSHENEQVRASAAGALSTKTKYDASKTIPALIEAAQEKSYSVRSAASNSLRAKEGAAEEQIIAHIKNDDPQIRNVLAGALGVEGASAKAVGVLIDLFTDENAQVRERAAYSLASIRENAMQPLVAALQSEDWRLREGAARTFRNMSLYGDRQLAAQRLGVPAALTKALKEDTDLSVRTEAAFALGNVGAKESVGLLLASVDHSAPELRYAAVSSIANLNPPPEKIFPVMLKLLDDPSANVVSTAINLIGRYGPASKEAVPRLIEILDDAANPRNQNRNAAASALGQIKDERAVPVLARHAANDSEYLYSYCIRALGQVAVESDTALKAIEALTKADSEKVSKQAGETLKQTLRQREDTPRDYNQDQWKNFPEVTAQPLNDVRADQVQYQGKTLNAYLQDFTHEDDDVRSRAADAVAKFGDVAVAALVPKLKSEDKNERAQASQALNRLGPLAKSAIGALVESLGDEEWRVNSNARYTLQALGDDAVPAVTKALESESEKIRINAILVLGRQGASQQTIARLIGFINHEKLGSSARSALANCGRAAVGQLLEKLDSDDEPTRVAVSYSLASMGSGARDAVEPLIDRLQNDTSEKVRAQCAQALANTADAKAKSPLIDALQNDKSADVRRNALAGLGNLALEEEELMPLLVKSLQDENGNVIEQAARILYSREFKREAARPAVLLLAATLQDTQSDGSWRRQYAAQALGKYGDKSAVPALISGLSDKSSYFRRYCIVALGNIGADAKAALPALRKLEDDEDESTRKAVALALHKIQMPG